MLCTVNKSPLDRGTLESCLRHAVEGAAILLIEDGVYGAMTRTVFTPTLEQALGKLRVYALKPDVEANLAAWARARGIPLDAYLQSVIEDLARTESGGPASIQDLAATLDALAETGKDLPHLPSSAFSRDSIYRDHN